MHVVTNGGMLFECYVRLLGSNESVDIIHRLERLSEREDEIADQQDELTSRLLENEESFFYGFVLNSVPRINRKCYHTLFWMTWNATFHGLSRIGVKVLSKVGLLTKMSTFDNVRKSKRCATEEHNK